MRAAYTAILLLTVNGCGDGEPSPGPDAGAEHDAGVDASSGDDGGGGDCVGCAPDATCEEGVCVCDDGYAGDGQTCEDVDECLVDNGGCDPMALCTNQPGSRSCSCQPGTEGDGETCVSLWSTLVSVEGLDLSSPNFVASASGRIYFGRGPAPSFFKSIDVDSLVIRDEAVMDDATNDICDCGMTATFVANDPWTILSFGDYGNSFLLWKEYWVNFEIPWEMRRGEAGGALLGEYVYLVGGRDPTTGEATDLPVRVDLTRLTFETFARYPVEIAYPAVAVVDGVLYAGGGSLRAGGANTTLAAYDPVQDGWAILQSTPFESGRANGVAQGGKLRVFAMDVSEVWTYDPSVAAWEPEPLSVPWGLDWKLAVVGDVLYLVGTLDGAFTLLRQDTP